MSDCFFSHSHSAGLGVSRSRNLRAGGQVLEEGHQRHRGNQDPQEPPVVCAPGTNRGVHPLAPLAGERRRVQLCARLRVLPAQESHMSRVRDARAEFVRLPETKQIFAITAEVHQTDFATGRWHRSAYVCGGRTVVFVHHPEIRFLLCIFMCTARACIHVLRSKLNREKKANMNNANVCSNITQCSLHCGGGD
jgi:hypothetical protein